LAAPRHFANTRRLYCTFFVACIRDDNKFNGRSFPFEVAPINVRSIRDRIARVL